MLKIKFPGAVFFMVLSISFSCDNRFVVSDSKEVESGVWNINEIIEFNAEISEPNTYYNFYIEMHIDADFLTNNLWLFIRTESPDGAVLNDTVMYYVADEEGRWYGTKSGKIIKNKFLYKPNIRFPDAGTYNIKIQHGMRENDLPKVSKIGIKIEELKEI